MNIKIYKWRCKVATPELTEDGVSEGCGLVAAEGLHKAMDRVLEYMCLCDEDCVFEFYIEPWDCDILGMDETVLKAVEEDHIF